MTILAICLVASSAFAAKKAVKPQPLLFPDGTPVSEWFQEGPEVDLESLGKQYNFYDYGIISSTSEVQTEKIQAIIDMAAENGGGVIVVPEGVFKSGALFFKQGTHLHLQQGAVLYGSEDILDFPLCKTRIEGEVCTYFPALININDIDGFTVTGKGTLDGNGSHYWQMFRLRRRWNPQCTNKDEMRPRLLHVSNCKNVEINGITLQNSPFWTCHIYKAENVKLINLRLFSPVRPIASPSADGIDLDVVKNVYIKGCRITVNDDSICFKGGKGPYADTDPNNGTNENILVEECFFDRSTGSSVTCGSECVHTRNVLVRNCKIDRGQVLLLLKMRPDTPQNYEYITFDGIEGSGRGVFSISRWTQFFDLKGRPDKPMSYGSHIIMKNIKLDASMFAQTSRVDDEYIVSDVTFENIEVTAQRADWNREAIDGLTVKNVTINGVQQ